MWVVDGEVSSSGDDGWMDGWLDDVPLLLLLLLLLCVTQPVTLAFLVPPC